MKLLAAALFSLALLCSCGTGDAAENDPTEGPFTFHTSLEPGTIGENTLSIHLHGPDGASLDGATLHVEATMPAHGHGSGTSPTVEALGDGEYRAFPVTFTMPGKWEVKIHATSGDLEGGTVLTFDVEG